MSALMQTYARLPVTFSHGEGVYLYDSDGRRYLDGISGIAVNGLFLTELMHVTACLDTTSSLLSM